MKIAVIGNCQGDIIAHAIKKALEGQRDFAVRYIPSYEAAVPDDRVFLREADKVLNQVTDGAPKNGLVEDIKNSSHELVHYPLLSCNFLYPFSIKPHPRSHLSRSQYLPAGFYQEQLSDSQLVTLMQKYPDRTPEDIADEFLALDYNDIIDLDALFDRSRAKAERAGAASGVNLWPRVERLFRYQPIFWTNLHPAEVLLRPLCKFALEVLDLGLSDSEIDSATQSLERLGFAHMPIHPSIVRHFGIEWATPHYRYKGFQEGAFTAHEYVCRFVRFDHDDGLAQSIHSLHTGGDVQAALSGLLAARDRHPEGPEIPIHLALAYLRTGDVRSALASAVSALERYPDQKDWAVFVCQLATLTLDSIQSEAKASGRVYVPAEEVVADGSLPSKDGVTTPAARFGRGWRRSILPHWLRFGRSDHRSEPSTFSPAAE